MRLAHLHARGEEKTRWGMKMNSIITSLADTDLYKLTMQQTVLHNFPGAMVEYRFKCRNTPQVPLMEFRREIEEELDALCEVTYADDELAFLDRLRYLKPDFVDFLRIFRLQRKFIRVIESKDVKGAMEIVIAGPWLHTIPFEVPVLSIVNEVYFRNIGSGTGYLDAAHQRLSGKIEELKRAKAQGHLLRRTPFVFFEFGTRRRMSKDFQRVVVEELKREVPEFFKGTSNIGLAREFDLTPIGTMAHEYLQACQAMGVRLRDFQRLALETWVKEYRGDLGIALTDVIGMDAFLKDFDLYYTKLYDGMRHDSGDPLVWGEKAIAHYQRFGIDPLSKMLVFSDGLNFRKAAELYEAFGDRTKTGFGIGTYLTNDCGIDPLEIVIKMVSCNGQPVAKLSDSRGKTMCKDEGYLSYLRSQFNIEG